MIPLFPTNVPDSYSLDLLMKELAGGTGQSRVTAWEMLVSVRLQVRLGTDLRAF